MNALEELRREMARIHPEAVTPIEWIAAREIVDLLIDCCRAQRSTIAELEAVAHRVLRRVERLEGSQPWPKSSETLSSGSESSNPRPQ